MWASKSWAGPGAEITSISLNNPFRTRLFLLAGVALLATSAWKSNALAGRIIVVDPGHAVKNDAGKIINPGASGRRGPLERDVALHVAETMEPLLEAQGAKVYMTRTSANPWRYGYSPQMDNRGQAILANLVRADIYVRIHCD